MSNFQCLIKNTFFAGADPTSLAIFRILFGFLMILDVPQERGLEDADIRFGDPNYCFFPLFPWISPLSVSHAIIIYSIMWIGAIGICIGLYFKISCALYFFPYLYFFLLDKSRWNNHSYLFGLITLLLWVSEAGNHMSFDAHRVQNKRTEPIKIPKWNYLILKFQFFILYFFAGIKKLDSDWIAGHSMKNLSRHYVFSPLKNFLGADVIEYYIVHMGGLFYDLSMGFMLNFEGSKKAGFILSIMFHGLNSQVFDIGMFPYVCLASLVVFVNENEFPCTIFQSKKNSPCSGYKSKKSLTTLTKIERLTIKEKSILMALLFYVSCQLFMPFSHFITRGYNNWTPGLYGYSWDMMVNSWETLHQKITIKDLSTGKEKYLDPDIWVTNDRWSSHADMAKQYAKCIQRNLNRYEISNVEIRFDIWKSLNGRFQQRMYDPRVDILQASWSPFEPVDWLLPLLREYSFYRENYFHTIADQVANWSSSSDVIFVADFPGLHLENYLPDELTNITLTVIGGELVVEQKHKTDRLIPWIQDHVGVDTGQFHKVHTVSNIPSLYMYTYANLTQLKLTSANSEQLHGNATSQVDSKGFVEILNDFLWEKMEIMSRCTYLVVNAYLNVFFNVPMVIRTAL